MQKYKIKDRTSNTIDFSFSRCFKGELPGGLKYSGEPANDYIDFFHYLKGQCKITNVVICYDPDQCVYSGAIGRESDFQFTGKECRYHDIQFNSHRLKHPYRISPENQYSNSGTYSFKGIQYFLQLDTNSDFNHVKCSDKKQKAQKVKAVMLISALSTRYWNYLSMLTRKRGGIPDCIIA